MQLNDLKVTIAKHRAEGDSERKLSLEVTEAFKQQNAFNIATPLRLGGLAMPLPNALNLLCEVATQDAAASWVIWNATLVSLYSRYMPTSLTAELFGRKQLAFCQSTIPAGTLNYDDDTAIVAGRWPLVSGSPGADWAILTCREFRAGSAVLDDHGNEKTTLVAVHCSDFNIIDTWNASGLRASGSDDLEVLDVTIEPHQIFAMDTAPHTLEAIDFVPIFPTLTAGFAAQTLGVSQSVLAATFDHAQENERFSARQDLQLAIEKHDTAVETATRALQHAAEQVWNSASTCSPVPNDQAVSLYAAAYLAIDAATAAVNTLQSLWGTAGLYVDAPIEKRVRDINAMSRHIVAQPEMRADVGRAKMGLVPNWPLFYV